MPSSPGRRAIRFAFAAACVVSFVLIMNAYDRPRTEIGRGIPIPALILLAVFVVLSFVSQWTTFGRYLHAIGGNRKAAMLVGIPIRRIVFQTYILRGVLCGVAAVVTTARLNAGTSSTGELIELNAVAAAVIGGASLGSGRGTVFGAIVGALAIQSLGSGMVLIGATSSMRMIVIGLILIVAVGPTGSSPAAGAKGRARTVAAPPLVEMRGVSTHFGGFHAVEDIALGVHAGEVVAVLGQNGAGRSTLMKLAPRAPPTSPRTRRSA